MTTLSLQKYSMAEPGAGEYQPPIRIPTKITPSKVIYMPDTLRGKVDQGVSKVKNAYGKYFKGENPLIRTKEESEK